MTASAPQTLPLDVALQQAVAHHKAGRFQEAEQLYRAILKAQPNQPDANHNLGVLAGQAGQHAAGLPYLKTALSINPSQGQYLLSYANALLATGQASVALNILQTAMQRGLDTPAARSLRQQAEAAVRNAPSKGAAPTPAEINQVAALFNAGRHAELESQARLLVERYPGSGFAWKALGASLHMQGKDALSAVQKATELLPDDAQAHSNLGLALQALGQLDNAVASYRRALEIKPDFAAHYNLGIALQALGQPDNAVASYRRALQIKPDFAEAHNSLGVTFYKTDRLEEAEASYRRALQIKPDFAEAHGNLGAVLHKLDRPEEAEMSYRRALEIKPDFAEAHRYLGNIYKELGRLSEAKACYRRAHQLGIYGARVKEALMLPAIIGSRQEMLESRSKFERNLDELIADKVALDDPSKDVGEANFYLAYHGLNDRDLQVKVAKYYEQACPSLLYTAPHCIEPKSDSRKKIRVGFLSKFLYNHSVSFCFNKIIETLSLKEQFEVVLISEHPIDEEIYSGFAGKRVHLPYNLVQAREMLAELELDVLVYLDIGMEPLGYFLAFSRLARVQCVLAGHPVTTGIANVDYFLSSDLIEPLSADEHYSEKLVRLPRPIAYFKRPALPATLKTRHDLNLPDGRHIYMCPMKLQKIHPDFDEAITRILQIDDNGVVVLFEDDNWPYFKKTLEKRFESSIPGNVRDRIIFLPWLKNPSDFISAIATADVILDPFHFGIGSTLAMTSVTGTPLVTKAGEFMRGRIGAFYCEMLDVTECIAEDIEGYARKAVEIASNQLLRENIRAKILKNNAVLYENLQPVEDLVDFFYSLTDNWHTA